MPSHLGQPGAFAQCSAPVSGGPDASAGNYATGERRKQLQGYLNKHGCHHCGEALVISAAQLAEGARFSLGQVGSGGAALRCSRQPLDAFAF